MLFKEINASETLLAACQEKLNKLTDIYSSSCSVTNQLKASISSCKRKLIKTKKRSQHALPDRGLDTPTASPLYPETSLTDMRELSIPIGPSGRWGDSLNSSSIHEDPHNLELIDYSGIQEMFREENPSNFQLRVRHILRVGRIQNMGSVTVRKIKGKLKFKEFTYWSN